jgi:putative ABC transport system permease protein
MLGAPVEPAAGYLFTFDLTLVEIHTSDFNPGRRGLALPVLASSSLRPNLRISALSMSTYSTGKGRFGTSQLDRLLSGANLWFTRRAPIRSLLLSVRNTFRSKGRLALSLITLTLGAATFIGVLSVRASLTQTVTDLIQYINFDIMLTLDDIA